MACSVEAARTPPSSVILVRQGCDDRTAVSLARVTESLITLPGRAVFTIG